MHKLIDKIVLELEKITDKMIPKVQQKMDDKIFSKFNDRGLKIAYWISSVLSKVFLLNLILGAILNLYIYGLNIFYAIVSPMKPYNWLINFILDFILPVLLGVLVYILIRIITKLLKEKITEEIELKSILFATGFYLIVVHMNALIGNMTGISNFFYRLHWKSTFQIFDIFYPLINILIPVVYIIIGIAYIKKSNCWVAKKI